MRTHGTIVRWNAERGFGFVRPAGKETDLFVHITAFERGSSPPYVGELISFRIQNHSGGPRAIEVQRTAPMQRPTHKKREASTRRQNGRTPLARWLVPAALLMAAVALLAPRIGQITALDPLPAQHHAQPKVSRPAATYNCGGRQHCSQMSSCDEAKWVLRNCPNTQMDGDGDGIPCETQWCR